LAIVIDSSGSLGADGLALEKSAARQLIDLLASRDAVGVWSFTEQVKQQIDFTTNHDSAKSAVSGINDTGGTALYQAVVTSAEAFRSRGTRRAIVLMTDGEDTQGGATLNSAIQAALAANTPIFTIGFGDSKPDVLKQMADQTGGFNSPSAAKAD